MAIYSIRDLEELTGIKAHTLRIWEKRYGIVKPKRTDTNIRYYEDDDLKTLFNVAILNRSGIKISKIAKMRPENISEEVASITAVRFKGEDQADALSLSLIDLDAFTFQSIINSNIDQMGFKDAMLEVVYPFIEKLNLLWLSGAMEQAHERFLDNLLRQKMMSEIDKLHPVREGIKMVVFLPQGNQQELSLLFIHYLLKQKGFRVINLGIHCDSVDVISAARISKAEYVLTMNTDEMHTGFAKFMDQLTDHLPCTLIVSGQAQDLSPLTEKKNIKVLSGMEDTLDYLSSLPE